ncbi:ribose-phosphate pyrophosphokinase [Leifsonia aquatica]|uniref:ribose-phosphate pyrophosphokinase n=1 Tax=Leifsonia aquatica TaxID=144185 RepID=UPI00384FE5DF
MSIEFQTLIGPGYISTPTFAVHRFWAGESHVVVENDNVGKGPLTEVARLSGADGNDLFTLAMWADAAHQRGARTIALIPYLPGARQDRGIPFGAKVYADFLNALQLDRIVCLDPHSPVMPGLITGLRIIDSAPIIRRHVVGRADRDARPQRYTGVIAPDAGARERAARVARSCHLPLYQAAKHRDPSTRQLSGFSCDPLPTDGRYLVVDDICDGGGTFIGLAEATGLPAEQLGLYVSHGVYTSRAATLAEHFAEIWTTNSFAPDPHPEGGDRAPFHTIDIDSYLKAAAAE